MLPRDTILQDRPSRLCGRVSRILLITLSGRANYKTGRNVPVIDSWRPLHVSVILVDDGPGDPREKRIERRDKERKEVVRASLTS